MDVLIGEAGRRVVAAEELDLAMPVAGLFEQFARGARERVLTVHVQQSRGDLGQGLTHRWAELLHEQDVVRGEERQDRGGAEMVDHLVRRMTGPSLDVQPEDGALERGSAARGLRAVRHGRSDSADGDDALRPSAAVGLRSADELPEERVRPGGP